MPGDRMSRRRSLHSRSRSAPGLAHTRRVRGALVGKVALIGGGGGRSPLLMYGLNEARKAIGVDELVIYDTDLSRAVLMAKLGEIVVAHNGGDLRIGIVRDLARAVDGASFVLNSIRVGGIAARARDERIA